MAQSDFPNGGSLASVLVGAQGALPKISDGLLGHQLSRAAVAEFVLGAPRSSVIALGGVDGESLRGLLDQVEPTPHCRVALFVQIVPEPSPEAIVEQVIDLLAETARRLWPVWFTNVSFSGCRNDEDTRCIKFLGSNAI